MQRSYAEVHDTIRIAAYNLLDYPSNSNPVSDTTLRNPYFRTIVQAMNPDILVVEEINSLNGLDGFLLNVLNADSSNFSKGDFHDGPDTDNGIFFKTSAFRFISNRVIPTDLRDINEFTLIHLLSGDTLRIYAVHLKASSGSSNEAQRALEVDSLRKITNALPAGSNFMVMGDFNIYQSGEAAYEKLLDTTSGNEGYFIDPVVMPGVWNNISYSVHHTQSTRTRSFGNGVTGGMDDRFDLLMFSNAVSQPGGIEYVPGSQIAFGNDGNHYNDSINQQPNTAVSPQVANALHYASDHLPIIAGFTVAYSPENNPTDVGVTTLITPADSICPEAAHPVVVAIKNFAQTTLDFTSTPVDITVRVTRPDAGLQTFSITLNSGSLSAGAQQICTVSTSCDMSMSGTYTFTAWASSGTDTNHGNDTLPPVPVTVRSVPQ
ncbi:MAG: hypothetical protein IT242_07605, partial [Bacteroidia bacterium]|nr:hypothetical protein [Bacteroidia bacterium]